MTSTRPRIRDASTADLDAIVRFNQALAKESEGRHLMDHVIRAGVMRALNHPALCRYVVAEMHGEVIGQTMITFEVTDWEDGLVYWIQSVYVRPEYRGRGIFRALYEHVVDVARRSGDGRKVRLYVEKENRPAIAVYEKLGMNCAHFHIYETDLEKPT